MENRGTLRGLNSSISSLAVGLLALLAFTSPAFAQSELEGKSFDELIGEAKTAYEGERFDEAIKYLLAANRAQPNARLLLNVAKSYEKSGKCVEAMVYFRAFVRDPDAESALAEQARASLANASKCQGWNDLMSGRLMLSASPKGASATVDGKPIGTLPTEVVGLMEGDHTVVITLDGYEPHEETLKLYPDKDATVKVALEEARPEVVVEETPPPAIVEPEPTPMVPYLIAGGVSLVGVSLFVVGAITDAGLPGKYDDPRQRNGITQGEFDDLTAQRKSAATRALVFYIVGGVLMAGGAGYGAYVAVTSGEKEEAPRLTLAPEVGPTGLGLSLTGKF